MLNIYVEHPDGEALERLLLNHSDVTEIELIETHIMACALCVRRLEAIELEITAIKIALQATHRERLAKAAAGHRSSSWCSWITLPRLSMASTALALALEIFMARPIAIQNVPARLDLVPYRGLELPAVTKNHRFQIHVTTNEAKPSAVEAELLDDNGTELWKAITTVSEGGVDIDVPEIHRAGAHFFRLYSVDGSGRSELFREFAFQVK